MIAERLFSPIGDRLIQPLEKLGDYLTLVGGAARFLWRRQIHWKNTLQQLAFVGTDSLPIVLVTMLAVGAVFTLQIADQFIKYGASSMVGGAAALALVRELAPLMTGVVVAGRVGAAFAAELGSMKVTEQLDALTAMAVHPLYYLVLPRLLASCLMLPVLALLGFAVGTVGGLGVGVGVKGIILVSFVDSVQGYLSMADIVKSLLKASVFGFILASVGCFMGVKTGEGAQGVGRATTGAVVVSLIAIFVSNYFMSAFLWRAKVPF